MTAFLGLDVDAGHPIRPRHRRQADPLDDAWIACYRTEVVR